MAVSEAMELMGELLQVEQRETGRLQKMVLGLNLT
jgi:hypothetical protein